MAMLQQKGGGAGAGQFIPHSNDQFAFENSMRQSDLLHESSASAAGAGQSSMIASAKANAMMANGYYQPN